MAKKYRALNGLNYPVKGKEKRVEPGEVVSDLPANAIEALLKQGDIEPVGDEKGGEA